MGLDEFETVFYSVHLAKELYDIGRFDVLSQLYDEISYDWHFENVYHVMMSIFARNYNNYDEEDCDEVWLFEDDVISDYFLYAREYGIRHNLPQAQNPYVAKAKNEVRRRLCISNCVDWKLLAYTKTKKTARQSKLVVCHYTDCGCNAIEGIVYGLVKLYGWFADKCAKFEALENGHENAQKAAPPERVKFIVPEVMAA